MIIPRPTNNRPKSAEEQDLINGVDVKQKQFESLIEQKTTTSYEKPKKNTSIIIPYIIIGVTVIFLILFAIIKFNSK